jgi:hypothetical protein
MRKHFVLLWLLCPVFALTYHFTEGQAHVEHMRAAGQLELIRQAENDGRWSDVIDGYEELKGLLPEGEAEIVFEQIALAQAYAQVQSGFLSESIRDLSSLLTTAELRHGENAEFTRAVRGLLGRAHYDATVILRASGGAPEALWRQHADLARQQFRYLAENHGAGRRGAAAVSYLSPGTASDLPPSPSVARSGTIQHIDRSLSRYDVQGRDVFNLHALHWAMSAGEDDLASAVEPPAAASSALMASPPPPPVSEKSDEAVSSSSQQQTARRNLAAEAAKRAGS